jgi:DNA-binding NarL/FixJ family response regulator
VQTLLIDDHNLFRQGLKFLLSDLDETITFFEAESCDQALKHADASDVGLILLDLHMPGLDGLDALTAITEHFKSSVVVVLSSEDDPQVILKVIESGASGFIPKSSTPEVLIAALRLILAGGVYLPPTAFQGMGGARHSADVSRQPASKEPVDSLSERQLQVLLLAVQGKSNKVIARDLKIAPGTVKQHLSAAFRALGVKNRTEAVFASARMGLTPARGGPQA